jgi:hypothetical protein
MARGIFDPVSLGDLAVGADQDADALGAFLFLQDIRN